MEKELVLLSKEGFRLDCKKDFLMDAGYLIHLEA
jgi:hypothetical protein